MSATTAEQLKPVEEARGRRGPTLAAVLLAVFVVPMSISGTAVALPAIGADLGASDTALQWVVNAFNVAFACCTLVWGSVADVVGRVRVFAAGAALFAVASAVSALAPGALVLDVARALAGVGGAAIFSAGAAILSTAYEGPARARAFALFGTVAGVGISLGPTLAGQLVATAGWRWVFALHAAALAVALLAVPLIARSVPTSVRGSARVDVVGGLLFVATMVLLTTGIVQASQWGWGSAGVLALFVAAVVALCVFVGVERRSAHPVLDLGLLRERRFVGLALVPVAASFGFVTMLTYLPSYLTAVTGRDGSAAGWLMLLLTVPVLVSPVLAAKLVERGVSATVLILVSLGCLVVGDLGLLLFSPHVSVAVVALPMIVTGAGMGLSAGLVDGQALALVAPERAGMAAGFVNTLRLGGEAVAVAAYGSVVATLTRSGTYDSAFHVVLGGLVVVGLLLGGGVAVLLRRR
ncbi:MFS transporter [Streptomyces endophyticus]|uniref:MFS transporter n=1 Tax=Streptomyces endophyticus TaxID=714166 RepID=A0ABU6FHW1_9ACTN|nr:MFS transporter [Streptomyces endophyticus]MEB8343078.1 MFS transporter [Streptomyces endophyticus]